MDPWINNIPVFGQSGTPVYGQLRAYSDPNASQQHASASNYMPFAPLYQTSLTVYNAASSNENQSDSSSPSLCEPAGSTSSDDPTATKKIWLKEDMICLIDSYAKKKDDFRNPRIRNKDIWSDISNEMQAQGHVTCDAKSCKTKFKNLKRSYTACIDHNKKTGNDRKKCAFYDELHGIFHGDDNIEPPAVYSNRKGLVKINQAENQEGPTVIKLPEESSEGTASEDQEEENNIKKKQPRKKAPSERSELVSLFKEFVDRKEEKEEKKLQKLQEMHNEKMTFLGQFLI